MRSRIGRPAFFPENALNDIRKTTPAAPAAVARTLDACHYLNVSRSTLYRLVRNGKLKPIHLGERAVGYSYAQLDAYIAAATAE